MTAMATEEPETTEQSLAMTSNMSDSDGGSEEDDNSESGEDEAEDPESEFSNQQTDWQSLWCHISNFQSRYVFHS